MRRGRGYPVAVVVLLALLVSATALLGRGSGPAPVVPACTGGGCESRAVDAFDLISVVPSTGTAQDAEFEADSVEEVLEKGLAVSNAGKHRVGYRLRGGEDRSIHN